MGILEQILSSLTRIENQLGINADDNSVQVSAPALPVTPATPLAPAATGEVNEHGIPWNAEFHASTKTTNQDGHWKGKKGVDKAALEAYNAQFTKPAVTAPVTAPVVAATPPVPATPGLPPVPPVPATPATPPVPAGMAEPSPDHLEAVKYIQSLTNDYKVAYPLIVSSILAKHGAADFQSCNPQFHAQIKADAKHWVEKLAEIDQSVEVLDSINNKTGGTHGLPGHVATVLSQAAGTAVVGEIPFDKLADTATAIAAFAKQWDDYCVATTGAGYL